MMKEKLLKDIQEILKHKDTSKIAEEITELVMKLKASVKVTASSITKKERGIMASVALKAAVTSDEGEREILYRANRYYIWLRVKQEVGMPQEVAEKVKKNPPF